MSVVVYRLCLIFLSLLPLASFANEKQWPPELLYQGKPIDPLCFYAFGEEKGKMSLSRCGIHAESGRKITGQNNMLIDEGYFGYDYSWKIDETSSTQGYSYYKPLGMINQLAVIGTLNNSGGTGQFSSLSTVSRKDNTIQIKTYEGGDRCNGGVQDIQRVKTEQGELIQYRVNLTAFDFLALTQDNPYSLKPYDDLDSCAVCCIATAVYQRPLNEHFSNEEFKFIDLTKYLKDISASEQSSPLKYQACFNQLLLKTAQKYHHLDQEALLQFTHQFNETCVHEFKQNVNLKKVSKAK